MMRLRQASVIRCAVLARLGRDGRRRVWCSHDAKKTEAGERELQGTAEERAQDGLAGSSPSDRIDLEPLPSPACHCPGKELGVHDLGQDFEALDDARAGSVEVGG